VLVHPSGIDLSSSALRCLSRLLAARRRERGTRWRRRSAVRQALAALAHLRCGHTCARLAAGFGVGIVTVYHYIAEAVEVLAAVAPDLAAATLAAARKAFVIPDGTLPPIHRPPSLGPAKVHGRPGGIMTGVPAGADGRSCFAYEAVPEERM